MAPARGWARVPALLLIGLLAGAGCAQRPDPVSAPPQLEPGTQTRECRRARAMLTAGLLADAERAYRALAPDAPAPSPAAGPTPTPTVAPADSTACAVVGLQNVARRRLA